MAVGTGEIKLTWESGQPAYVYWGTVFNGTPRSYGDLAKTKNINPGISGWSANDMKGTTTGVFTGDTGSDTWGAGEYGTHSFTLTTDTAWTITISPITNDNFSLANETGYAVLDNVNKIYGGNGSFDIIRTTENVFCESEVIITYTLEGSQTTHSFHVFGNI
jgi:hypothetical protein